MISPVKPDWASFFWGLMCLKTLWSGEMIYGRNRVSRYDAVDAETAVRNGSKLLPSGITNSAEILVNVPTAVRLGDLLAALKHWAPRAADSGFD